MPIPTEVLNEDVKELKAEVRDIRSNLDVLRADVHRIDVGLAELRSDVRSIIGIGKWAATILVTAVLASSGGAIWWASSVSSDVRHLSTEVADLRKAIEGERKGAK